MDTPAREAAPEAAEIDISNEWEEMIEVEPDESPAPALELQSYQEIMAEPAMTAEVPLEPVVSIEPKQPDVSAQVADKVQEIRFYITQQMWEQAKAAILDLTELAPDAPEVTKLIAEISAGQAKGRAAAVEPAPVEVEEAPAAFAPIEVAESFAAEPLPAVPVMEDQPIAAPAAALDLENVLDIAEPPSRSRRRKRFHRHSQRYRQHSRQKTYLATFFRTWNNPTSRILHRSRLQALLRTLQHLPWQPLRRRSSISAPMAT